MDYLDIESTPVPSVTSILPTMTPSPEPIHLEFPGEVYHHPQGLFEFPIPKGWKLVSEQDGAVEFIAPGKGISIFVFTTNTGQLVDEESFRRFVDAQEVNLFSAYPGYLETERNINLAEFLASVEKHVRIDTGNRQVLSFYRPTGTSILTLNIWSNSPLPKETIREFRSFFLEIHPFDQELSNQPIYQWVYEFLGGNGVFTGQVPLQWERESIQTDTTQIDRFVSPDQNATLHLAFYNNGEQISKEDAGFIALEMLHKAYGTNVTITDDRLIPLGGELLRWTTIQGEITGATFFEINDTDLMIMTWSYPTTMENIYYELFQQIFESIHF